VRFWGFGPHHRPVVWLRCTAETFTRRGRESRALVDPAAAFAVSLRPRSSINGTHAQPNLPNPYPPKRLHKHLYFTFHVRSRRENPGVLIVEDERRDRLSDHY